jgi:phage shock protein E
MEDPCRGTRVAIRTGGDSGSCPILRNEGKLLMLKNHLKLCFSVVAWGLMAGVGPCLAADHTKDSLETVKKNLTDKRAVLVDVREPSEWDEGHIAGATSLPLSQLKKGMTAEQLQKKLPQDKIIYTYCLSGARCRSAADILAKYGYSIRPLKPGYEGLVQAGFQPEAK